MPIVPGCSDQLNDISASSNSEDILSAGSTDKQASDSVDKKAFVNSSDIVDLEENLPVSSNNTVEDITGGSHLDCSNSTDGILENSVIGKDIPIQIDNGSSESSVCSPANPGIEKDIPIASFKSSVCSLANPDTEGEVPLQLSVCSDNTVAFRDTEQRSEEASEMEKKKQAARKSKVQEQDDSQNDSILEEVLSIAGKREAKQAKESADSPPTKLKKAANGKAVPSNEISDPSSAAENIDAPDGEEAPLNLPKGWKRKTVVRKSGKTAGQIDVYFYSPDGTKLRSKPDVSSYLTKNKLSLKIEDFDFSKKAAAKPPVVASSKKDMVKDNVSANKRGKSARKEVKSSSDEDGVGNKNPPKVVPAKKQAAKPTPRKLTKVPQPTVTEKNNSPAKAEKIVVQILASKKKRSRK